MGYNIHIAPKKKLRVLVKDEAEKDYLDAKKKYKELSSFGGLAKETIKGLPQATKKVILNLIAMKAKKKK